MNLETLSLTELKEIETKLPVVIAAKKVADAAKVKADLEREAMARGFTMADIFGDGKNWRRPVEPKYRDPKSGKTWSARGRAPLWMPKRRGDWHKVAIDAR